MTFIKKVEPNAINNQAKVIKEIIDEKNWTVKQASELSKIPLDQLQKVYDGKVRLNEDGLFAFANAAKMSPLDITGQSLDKSKIMGKDKTSLLPS